MGGGTIYGAAAAYETVALETRRVFISPRVGEQMIFSGTAVSRSEIREPQNSEEGQMTGDTRGQTGLSF